MSRAVIVIPARYASTRLPAKALLAETGKTLVEHVHEAASRAEGFDGVYVATDDERIARVVRGFGGRAILTSPAAPSGTDRIAEAVREIEADIVVNLQGDEPEMEPRALSTLLATLVGAPRAGAATLATPITRREDFENPSIVKVVRDDQGFALYFSRSPIPYPREGPSPPAGAAKHIGVYAYRREVLLEFARLPPSPIERIEGLEQLRLLAAGHRMAIADVELESCEVNTPEDYRRFVEKWRARRSP